MVVDSFCKSWYEASGRLAGCAALITDVSIRTGQAIAVAFAREGAHVGLLHAGAPIHAKAVKALIEREGGHVSLIPTRIEDEDVWLSAMDQALHEMGKVDILVNVPAAPAPTISSDWSISHKTPCALFSDAVLELIEVFAANTVAGVVVNGIFINDDPKTAHATSSDAVAGATWTIDQASKPSLRVNAIRIASPGLQARFPAGEDEYLAEVAMGCVFLASSEASSLSGSVLSRDLEALID